MRPTSGRPILEASRTTVCWIAPRRSINTPTWRWSCALCAASCTASSPETTSPGATLRRYNRSSALISLALRPARFPVTSSCMRRRNLPIARRITTDIVRLVARRFRALVAHPQVEALGELAELLGGLGLVVDTARSTVEAINKLRGAPAHVVVPYHVSSTSNPFDGVGFLESSNTYAPPGLRVALVNSPDEAV